MPEQQQSEAYLQRQRRNLAEIEELRSKFEHEDIRQFHKKHLGEKDQRGNYGSAPFIPTESCYRDKHDAIYSLLSFLDSYGDVPLPVGNSSVQTTLRKHNLRVVEVIIDALNRKQQSSYYLFSAGIAALANNMALGLGSTYCEHYNKGKEPGPVSLGQASLAILEQMPEIRSLYKLEEIQEIIKFFSLCVDTSINNPKFPFDKENVPWNLAKLLAAAEHQVRREEIFHVTEKPEGFWSVNEEAKEKKAQEATEIAQQAESERQQLDIQEYNRDAYLEEIKGLRNTVAKLKPFKTEAKFKSAIIAAQKKIITALENKDEKALKSAQNALEKAQTALQIFEQGNGKV